jgi:WD40 repeat protein
MQDIYLSFKFCLIGSESHYISQLLLLPNYLQLPASSNMIDSSKYVFVETKSSWLIRSSHHYLSFSSDGTTITGSTKSTKSRKATAYRDARNSEDGRVQFWETATGVATWSFERSSYVVFSPTDPNIAALVRPRSVHMVKRDSFKGKTWGGQTSHYLNGDADAVSDACTFNSDGKTIVMPVSQNNSTSGSTYHLQEYDPLATTSKWSMLTNSKQDSMITSIVCCPIAPGLFAVGNMQGELVILSKSGGRYGNFKSLCRLIPVDPVSFSACAWSQDGKWIATGNTCGDVFLWNAGVLTSVSFAMALPRNLSNLNTSWPITSLIFVPDSTALIMISGGYLSVWDIENAEYVTNSGLPDTATNIALDGPRNRFAVVVDDRITIYELKLPEEMCQMDGKSSVSSEL